jgi:hypothetical protein
MDSNTQWIMVAAISVAAAAIVLQAGLMFAMYRNTRALRDQVIALVAKIEPIAENSQRLLEETRTSVADITTQATELLAIGRRQLTRVDEVMSEATTRARAQMDRIEMVLDDTVNRFQETTTLLQNGVLKPLKQISALAIGVRAGFAFLLGARRTTVEQATHDEEMFI